MRALSLVAVLTFCGTVGCQEPAPPAYQTAALVALRETGDLDRLWDACTEVLRQADFRPDRQDRRAGVITTVPVTSAHWFEFWRHDVLSAYAFAESNLATIRRAATVQIDATDQPDEYVLAVRVDVERLSTPERQVTSPAGGLQIFGTNFPTTEGRKLKGDSPDRWVPLGRDPDVEFALLSRMIEAYGPERYEYVDLAPTAEEQAPAEEAPPS